jgi:short-subunit dehydrogenase
LKKKYNAEWAIVTGGSSGIGKAISEKLASQGINVIIVAVPDNLLPETVKELSRDYPKLQFIPVGVDLSKPGYMEAVAKATEGKDIQLLFCNAGFMKTGFFVDVPLGLWKANNAVNVCCHVDLTHEYIKRMNAKNLKGCVIFTSSPASFMPSPFTAMYGATKAFVTEFAAGVAAEVRSSGVDVCVVHPSPVASRFYDNAHKIDEIKFFQGTATTPAHLVDRMFAAVGRLVVCNQGYYPASVIFVLKMCDWTFMVELIARIAHTLPSFKAMKKTN